MKTLAIATIAAATGLTGFGYGQVARDGAMVGTTAPATQSTTAPSSQPATAPTTAPATQPTIDPERYLDRLLRAKPGSARPLQPLPPEQATDEPLPKKKPAAFRDPNLPLKRDGDEISERLGYLQRTPEGTDWQYAFESAEEGMVDPPMVLIPNSGLAAMEQAQQRAGKSLRFRVTGLITSYEGKNYLLVERAREWPKLDSAGATTAPMTEPSGESQEPLAPADGRPATIPVTQPSTGPATEPTTQPATEPSTQPVDPEQVLERLLRPRPKMAAPLEVPLATGASATTRPGIAPAIPEVPLKREGEMVSQRVGRLQKSEQGTMEFVFEADDRGMTDPPMTLIPNQKLYQMQGALERSGVDLRFRVTGLITAYGGRNYLLIEKAELVTDHEGL